MQKMCISCAWSFNVNVGPVYYNQYIIFRPVVGQPLSQPIANRNSMHQNYGNSAAKKKQLHNVSNMNRAKQTKNRACISQHPVSFRALVLQVERIFTRPCSMAKYLDCICFLIQKTKLISVYTVQTQKCKNVHRRHYVCVCVFFVICFFQGIINNE